MKNHGVEVRVAEYGGQLIEGRLYLNSCIFLCEIEMIRTHEHYMYFFLFDPGLPVAPGNRATWDAQLLKIPAVSPTIVNCCVIKVEYYVKVGHVR